MHKSNMTIHITLCFHISNMTHPHAQEQHDNPHFLFLDIYIPYKTHSIDENVINRRKKMGMTNSKGPVPRPGPAKFEPWALLIMAIPRLTKGEIPPIMVPTWQRRNSAYQRTRRNPANGGESHIGKGCHGDGTMFCSQCR